MTTTRTSTIDGRPVVDLKRFYMYDDLSGYSATTWDAATGQPVGVAFGSTYGLDAPSGWDELELTTDADALAAFKAHNDRIAADLYARRELNRQADAFQAISKGRHIQVIAGRKVPLGTQGFVFWIEDGGYGKVGVENIISGDDGRTVRDTFWTYLKNIAICEEQPEFPDLAELREEFLKGVK